MGLNLGTSSVLRIVGLRLRDNGGSTVARVAARRVRGSVGVRGVEVLFEVHGPRDPLKVVHVAHPDVAAVLTSLNGSGDEDDDVSKNYEGSRSARPTQLHRL